MARYCGKIGFSISKETAPGIYEDDITERTYYGDVVRDLRKENRTDKIVRDVTISNSFSVVADPFALRAFRDSVRQEFGMDRAARGAHQERPGRD